MPISDNKAMRVLFLAYDTIGSGPRDRLTYNFIEKEMVELKKEGVDVYFLSRNLTEDKEIEGVKYIAVDLLLGRNRLFKRLAVLMNIVRNLDFFRRIFFINPKKSWKIASMEKAISVALAKYDIKIIHSHFLWPAGSSGVLSSSALRVPIIATLRGAELANFPELDYGSMRNRFFQKVTEFSLKKVDRFTTPSRQLATTLQNHHDVDPGRVHYLPNGVEPIPLIKQELEPNQDLCRLIAIGRLVKLKNHGSLIQAIAKTGNKNITLDIIGGGEEHSHLSRLIEKYALQDRVKIIGEMSKDHLYQKMTNCDCLVHPSYTEGMPNVVLEALSMGIPCLVSNIPVHQELIRENINGWLFDLQKMEELTQKIQMLANEKKQLAAMAEACSSSIGEYTLDRKVKGYKSIYQNLIN